MSKMLRVPKEVLPSLAESYLSRGYSLYLFVRRMTEKKEFGCDYCGASIVAWSPDDNYVILTIEKGKESIERKIKCPKCEKDNVRYWEREAGPQVAVFD